MGLIPFLSPISIVKQTELKHVRMYRAKSARSGYSDESRDHETDSAQLELQTLQQRFRIVEAERQRIRQTHELTKDEQGKKLRQLSGEDANLAKNLKLATSKSNRARDGEYSEEIRRGVIKKERLKEKIDEEKQLQTQLDHEVKSGEKKTKHIRIKSATLRDKQGTSDHTVKKKQNDLEGRLYRANSQYNQQVGENGKLREEIETHRIKYRNFQNDERRLSKAEKNIKAEINEVIEASQDAHEQREDAKNKTIMLRSRAEKDLQQYDTDIKEEERSAENDFQLKEFMEVKNQEREEASHHNSKKVGGKLREKEQLIAACEESWARIQEITGTSDLDTMIDDFVTVEQQSFALFNFINEQNNNIEQKTEDIEHITAQYNRHQKIIKAGEQGRNELLEGVKAKVATEQQALVAKECDVNEAQDKFDEIASGLNGMLKSIDVEYAIGNMGDMLESLGVIEDKINELIAARAVLLEELDPENIAEIKRMLVPDPPAISMNDEENILGVAPSTSHIDNEIHTDIYISPVMATSTEDPLVPLTINEMRRRVAAASINRPQAPPRRNQSQLASRSETIRSSELDLDH